MSLLGFCRWFAIALKQGAKEIPPEVVDKGCRFYERRPSYPLTPHYHTCRACTERHRWECKDTRCVWTVLFDCSASAAANFPWQRFRRTKP
jgi:hypothetical protein